MGINNILVTGAAGFIGFHTILRLAKEGYNVTGIDNLNTYYDVMLKRARLIEAGISLAGQADRVVSKRFDKLVFSRVDITDERALNKLFEQEKFDVVIHLAAQSGVKYSVEDTKEFIESNNSSFLNILEACRHHPVKHLIYASSGSVYGVNIRMPFSEMHKSEHPLSLYAAAKRWNEMMARTYASLFDIPTTGLRFFTVYGPWGRPDMSYYTFVKSMLAGKPIEVVYERDMERFFTYIDDIVESIVRLIEEVPEVDEPLPSDQPDLVNRSAHYRILDIGNDDSVKLQDFIHALEHNTGVQAKMEVRPMQPEHIAGKRPDVNELERLINYKPETPLDAGVANFVKWYKTYYGT
ncbi:MAG: NAD-dependent epimerase/dehydratase family protein [Bacteroidales bacterium]|nr:NAD-dependent epimerase/dehydratase family protein [Bacteroidales bacterium]